MKLEEVNLEPKKPWITSCSHWRPDRVKSSPHISEQWRSFIPTASATSCSSRRQKPDATNVAGLRTWNSLGRFVKRAKKASSFSPRWSENEARRMYRPTSRVKTQQRRVSGRCTDSGPSMFSTDYLVICGRASARSMESRERHFGSPLDSSKHIIAQLLYPVQRSLMQGSSYRHPCPLIRSSERECLLHPFAGPLPPP